MTPARTGVVGLDIGTSAVRAAQVASARGAPSLVKFGQVPLPPGAVSDGEIRDPEPVSDAIAQLWKRVGMRTRKAIIGVANQRVVVRQVDVPYLEEKDFRSSLRFQVSDHIPMPLAAAELDYQIVEDYVTDEQEHRMRVLLVAAATDMVRSFVDATATARVEPAGVDVTPFAVARAVSSAARGEAGVGGAEAIVDVGASVTNIVIHDNGEPRFVRILLVGGDALTSALAEEFDVGFDEAEAIKLDLARGVGSERARRVLSERARGLVDEIRGSLDYYLGQEESQPVTSIILTGGGSLTPGLLHDLEQALRSRVVRATPLADMDVKRSGLTAEQVKQVEPVAAAAVGLALGVAGP